jgi:farnesyl diphosphate synthase
VVLARSLRRDGARGCAVLALAAGAAGMAGGQAQDLDAVGRSLDADALARMHAMKTGALIRAAVAIGSLAGDSLDPAEHAALDAFAGAAGLAFQVVDDVLDVEGSAATLGKTAGKDAAHAKPTYVTLLGAAGAKAHAERLRHDAHAALAPYGTRGRRLRELADWIAVRRH